MTSCTTRHDPNVVHDRLRRSREAGCRLMARLARLCGWNVVRRFPQRSRAVVAGRATGHDPCVIHGGRDPDRCVVANVTGARGYAALVPGRDAARQRIVVTGRAGRRRYHRVVHRRRAPARRPVTAVARDPNIGPAFVRSWDAGRRATVMTSGARTRSHSCMTEARGDPGGRIVTGVAGPRGHAALVPGRDAA